MKRIVVKVVYVELFGYTSIVREICCQRSELARLRHHSVGSQVTGRELLTHRLPVPVMERIHMLGPMEALLKCGWRRTRLMRALSLPDRRFGRHQR